jgi:hypothetical protein
MTDDEGATRRHRSRHPAHQLNAWLIASSSTYQLRRALSYYQHQDGPEAKVIVAWLRAELDSRAADVAARRSAESRRTGLRPLH